VSAPAPGSPAGTRVPRAVRDSFTRSHRRIAVNPAKPNPTSTSAATATSPSEPSEKQHFGACLRRARESRHISLSDVALKTKVARSTLELLETGELEMLPTGVYARGFIRSFARVVGIDETEPLLLYERAVEARAALEKARSTTPVLPVPEEPDALGLGDDDEGMAPRRALGLAVFVIILLLIATITLSLLLRRPPPSGEGLSVAPSPAGAVLIAGADLDDSPLN